MQELARGAGATKGRRTFFLFLIYTATVASSVISTHMSQIAQIKSHNGEILRTGVVFLWLTSALVFSTIFSREDGLSLFAADMSNTANRPYAGMGDAEQSDSNRVPQATPPSADL